MVREVANGRGKHLVLALALAICLGSCRVAYAVEGDTQPVEDSSSVSAEIEGIRTEVQGLSETVSQGTSDILVYLRERDALSDAQQTAEQKATEGQETELQVLQRIDSKLLEVVGSTVADGDIDMTSYDRAASLVLTAYGNTSPTSQYANYARGIVPKLGWDDHYVFLQDGTSSYVMVWGDLELADSNTITGSGCKYTRWYFVNQSTGYQCESGTSDVSVTLRGYQVISDLGDLPMFSETSDELTRRELMLYAVVAVCVFSLHSVWRYLLRNRAGIAD